MLAAPRQELPVHVISYRFLGKAARREHHAGEADQRQAGRRDGNSFEQIQRHARHVKRRQARRHGADHRDTMDVELEPRYRQAGGHHRHQCGWQAPQQSLREKQHAQGAQAHPPASASG